MLRICAAAFVTCALAARSRSFEEVLTLVRTALTLFAPAECRNYIIHYDYRSTVPLGKLLID